jgi:SEC-C motif-containing protein
MSKIGRNDPCPCGSGTKYKKCHLGRLADPTSPEFQAKAWALFDGKIAAERQRKQHFGEVRPIIHADAWGKKLVAVGSRIYFNDHPAISFPDFLQNYLRGTLGADWWKAEAAKPVIARHPVAQWQTHAEELMRSEKPDERGRYLIPRDGVISAFMALAYDLYIVRDNIEFQERIVDRLRLRDSFAGVRYELLVAATFVRAGFSVKPEDESSSTTHPEFVATHRDTGFVVAVEAKARNRRQSDRNPAKAGVDDLVAKAATQGPKDKPFALFVDVAMPPGDPNKPPSWLDEVDQTVKNVMEKHGGLPGPFDWVVFTNIPHQFGEPGGADPSRHWAEWLPRTTRISPAINQAVIAALQKYGIIPEFETGS